MNNFKVINSIEDFISLKGEELGASQYIRVEQSMINDFADVTLDHQWIHVNEGKSKESSPYKTTIAHGYLTLSLLTYLLGTIIKVNNVKQIIIYSVKDMVFKSPVPAGSQLCLKAFLKNVKDLGGICQASISCVFETTESIEPVLEGIVTYLYCFNDFKLNK